MSDVIRSQRIHVRRIAKNGEPNHDKRRVVMCPMERRFVDLSHCDGCPRMFAVNCNAKGSFMMCRVSWQPATEQVDEASVARAMSRDVTCVTKHTRVADLVSLLVDGGFGGAPVVDDDALPVGIVSKSDVVELAADPSALDHNTVEDIMTPLVFSVHVDTPLAHAAALMAYEHVHRVLVLDDTGKLVGMLTSIDVMRRVGKDAGYVIS